MSSKIPRMSITSANSNRQSRLPLRRSNSSTNLQVPKNAFRRSVSSSNLYATPKQTPRLTKSPRSDRKSEEFVKVKNFITNKNPNIGNLCPPTLNSFIEAFTILFKEIDSRITITKDDYEAKITNYLKLYRCPHTLNKSYFKTIGAMHSWPVICKIWIWFYELGQKVKNPAMCTEHLYTPKCNYLKNIIVDHCYKNNVDQNNEEEIIDLVRLTPGFNRVESIRDSYDKLVERNNELCEKVNKLKSSIEKYMSSIDYYKEKKIHTEDLIKQFCTERDSIKEKLTKDIDVLETAIETLKQNIANLNETINKQKYSIIQHEEIKTKKEEFKHTLSLKQSKNNEYNLNVKQQQVAIENLDEKLQKSIHHLNSDLEKLSLKVQVFKDVKISTKFVFETNENVNKIIQMMVNYKTNFQAVNYDEQKYELQKINKEIESLKVELKKLQLEVMQLFDMQKQNNSNTSLVQLKYEEKMREYEEILTIKLNPSDYKAELELEQSQANKAKDELKSYQRKALLEMHNRLLENKKHCKQFNNETNVIMKRILEMKKRKEADLLKATSSLKALQKTLKRLE